MCSANIVPKKEKLSQKVIFGVTITLKIPLLIQHQNKEVVQQKLAGQPPKNYSKVLNYLTLNSGSAFIGIGIDA